MTSELGARFQAFLEEAKLILMTPHGRAGSLFVHGLLDGHPHIISLPYFINKYVVESDGVGVEARVRAFLDANGELFAARALLKIENEQFHEIDREEIEREMLALLGTLRREPRPRDILCALFCAVARARGGDFSQHRYIAVHQHLYDGGSSLERRRHSAYHHERLMSDFPGGIYLALTLLPILSMASYLRERCDFFTLRYHLVYLKSCFITLRRLMKSRPDYRVALLDIDDINATAGQALSSALEQVGVEPHEALTVCTYAGVAWQGISSLNASLATFSPDSQKNKKAYIARQDSGTCYSQYLALAARVLGATGGVDRNAAAALCAPLRRRLLLGFLFSELRQELRENCRSVRGLRAFAGSVRLTLSEGVYLMWRFR